MIKYIAVFSSLLVAFHSGFCADKETKESLPAATATANNGFSGKVVETINAGEYTYVLVDTGKQKNWAAAPKFSVKVGDTVSIASTMPMPKYHSRILNRDFDVVHFTDRVAVNGKVSGNMDPMAQLPKDHPPIGGAANQVPGLPKDHPPIPAAAGRPDLELSGIKKAEGGKTVSEVYAEKEKLSGKQIKVRGKLVKYNANIMGKNWLHLRDGTGAAGSNDLLVTSSSPAKVGDTVLATGVISINKDFGSNYKYDVIMEDAKIVVE